jgi:large subunit ribosomal protein L6
MSRIGKKIRTIPQGVTIDTKGNELIVKGPKGELKQILHPRISIVVADGKASVNVVDETDNKDRALWGTFSSILGGMIEGVVNGFKKQLEINGVGFKASMKGADLALDIGQTNQTIIKAVPGVKFEVEKNLITVSGISKQLVGEFAARIRSTKKVEPYKGKGIKYVGEIVKKKAGKTAAKAAA